MRRFLWLGLSALSGLFSCNYTVGECYYRSDWGEGTAGVGGGVITTGGVGASGDAPASQPQAAGMIPAPDCNIAKQDPCNEKCYSDYEQAAIECGKIEDDGQRRVCQDAAYVVYKGCREKCAQAIADCKERCKKACDKIHDICHAKCNKNDPTRSCHARCNNEYAACLKDCDQNC